MFKLKLSLLSLTLISLYRCDGQNDDPFRACFGCEEDLERKHFFNKYTNDKNNFKHGLLRSELHLSIIFHSCRNVYH